MEDAWKHRNIKHIKTERKRSYFVSESNDHTTKFFTKNLLAVEIKKTQIFMNTHVYLDLSILDLSKTKLWWKSKTLLYAEDAEARVDISNYDLNRSHPKRENKKVISVMKDELDQKIIKESVGLRAQDYRHLIDDCGEDCAKKNCVIKRKHNTEDYKHCLEATQLEN